MISAILKWLGLQRVRFTVVDTVRGKKPELYQITEIMSRHATIQQINKRLLDFRINMMARIIPDVTDKYEYYFTVLK